MFRWSIFLFLCQYHTVLMTVALYYSLKSGRLISPIPFFLKTALATWSFLYFHKNCEIICSSSVKNTVGILWFCLSSLWWRRIRGLWKLPDGRDWLRGKLGLVLMGGAMLSSVQFSHSVMSDSLRPHELQHARPPCPSLTPRVHYSQWCHPAISSSDALRVFTG